MQLIHASNQDTTKVYKTYKLYSQHTPVHSVFKAYTQLRYNENTHGNIYTLLPTRLYIQSRRNQKHT